MTVLLFFGGKSCNFDAMHLRQNAALASWALRVYRYMYTSFIRPDSTFIKIEDSSHSSRAGDGDGTATILGL